MQELKKDIKSATEHISEIIRKHQIKKQELGDWRDFDDPRYEEGKVKEKVILVLRDLLEIEKEIGNLERKKELSELSKNGV